jgi:processive 1,2-diacylglycerol beta-glucosyltransferase
MRILITTVTAGAGHLHAAAALEEAWKSNRPDDTTETVDLLDFVPRLQRKLHADAYVRLVAHAPELYAMVFNRTDNPNLVRKLTRFRHSLAHHTNRRFVNHLRKFKPDVVVCTHYLPVEVLGYLKSHGLDPFPFVVCVVTDFEAHTLWMDPVVDLYCAAAAETCSSLTARGAAESRVAATGIPIASRFSVTPDASAIRRQLGLRDDLPTLLVLGGGFGLGPVGEILKSLDLVRHSFQTLVVCGRNQELRAALATSDFVHPTRVLGFVSNMHELMAVSDLILTKPGGLTSSEALALGKPLFILNPIPGQEAANSDFLLERGAATKVNRVEDLPFRLEKLLGSPKLAEMAAAAKALGRPNAASRIVHEITRHVTEPGSRP